jgi:hypothetical protein
VAFAVGPGAPANFPTYGGVGAFGLQGEGIDLLDQAMLPADGNYDFRHGHVYNLEGSRFIFRGGGASGAHSDIDNPEVGHAFWAAVLARPGKPAAVGVPAESGGAAAKPAPATAGPFAVQGGAAPGALEDLVRLARKAAQELGVRVRIEIDVEPPRP